MECKYTLYTSCFRTHWMCLAMHSSKREISHKNIRNKQTFFRWCILCRHLTFRSMRYINLLHNHCLTQIYLFMRGSPQNSGTRRSHLPKYLMCLFDKQQGTKEYKLPFVKNSLIFGLTLDVAGISEASSTKQ